MTPLLLPPAARPEGPAPRGVSPGRAPHERADRFATLLDSHSARTAPAEGHTPKPSAPRERPGDAPDPAQAGTTGDPASVAEPAAPAASPDVPAPPVAPVLGADAGDPAGDAATPEPAPAAPAVPAAPAMPLAFAMALGGAPAPAAPSPPGPADLGPAPADAAAELAAPAPATAPPGAPAAGAAADPGEPAGPLAPDSPPAGPDAGAARPDSRPAGEQPADREQPQATAPALAHAASPGPAAPAEAPAPSAGAPVSPTAPPPAPAPVAAPAPAQAATATPVPLARAADTVGQLLQVAHSRGITHARMALKPAELGGIEIRLQTSSAGVTAQVIADSPEATRMLTHAAADLRRSLESSGVPLLSLDVSTHGEGGSEAAAAGFAFHAEARERDGRPLRGPDGSGPRGAADRIDDLPTVTTVELPEGVLVDVLA